MTRHVIDHRNDETDPEVAARYADIERKQGPEGDHPAAKQAYRRPRKADSSRAAEYVRIEKGKEA